VDLQHVFEKLDADGNGELFKYEIVNTLVGRCRWTPAIHAVLPP
jgi:hypothetical protein